MQCYPWQLSHPISAIIFDCDGTLSKLEGINELAKIQGVEKEVSQLTEEAMSLHGLTPDVYQQRLALVKPTYQQVVDLGNDYFNNKTPCALQVINILTRLGKTIYLISAGVNPAVKLFGEQMQIPAQNIFAVDLQFNTHGEFLDFDHQSPLIYNEGKAIIIQEIKQYHEDLIYVGDGMNDLAAQKFVKRFIGYGGVFYRENIRQAADCYLTLPSFAPLLCLTLTLDEIKLLTQEEQKIYQQGVLLLETQTG